MSSPLQRKQLHSVKTYTSTWCSFYDLYDVLNTCTLRHCFSIAGNVKSSVFHEPPVTISSNPFISEITAKIVRLPAHCERNKDDTTIFAKLSHVSRRKCWERPHQPVTALYFTWLAYWPRSHATTYFDWSCLLVWTLTLTRRAHGDHVF